MIPWSSIKSFGVDAVVAEAAHVAELVTSEHDKQAVKGRIAARKSRVLDTNGFEQGTVEDMTFDRSTGAITGAMTTQGHLEATQLRSLGSYALIVDAD